MPTRRTSPAVAVLALVVALAVSVTACSGTKAPDTSSNAGTGSPTPVAGVAADLQPFYMQVLHWKGCGNGFQCSTLSVPMDYDRPATRTLHLALVRLPAGDQKHRLGSLVLNPGGPGGSGIEYARAAKQVISDAVRKKYDVVGFDPRGVGDSDPVHCLSSTETDALYAADPTPTTPDEIARWVALSRGLAEKCQARVGAELKFVGTRDAAHDMDVLRSAVGDQKLSYLGKSYGTLLGATYADQFPTHVGRMVLDGVVDPALTAEQINLGQAQGFERATRAFLADCAKHSDCALGTDVDAGLTKLREFLGSLTANPLRTNDSKRPLTEGWGSYGVAQAMYSKQLWPILRSALKAAVAGDGSVLLALADQYAHREKDGRYDGNLNDALYAVNCVDRPQQGGLEGIEQDVTTFQQAAPVWGSFLAWGALPCAYWPIPPTDEPKKISAPGSGPILVVGTTRDPATPYEWAVSLSKELSNGHLLTYDGDGHTAYREGSGCVDGVVDSYLLKAAVPPDGKRC
ncbi:MAG: alpha/beta hydrolase [Actinomycetales bacterium]